MEMKKSMWKLTLAGIPMLSVAGLTAHADQTPGHYCRCPFTEE
jgi:hypothetical protein